MAIPSESRLGASVNGDLADRVQQLRLDNQLGTGSGRGTSGGSLLPWILCGILAVTWAGVGVRWYKNVSQQSDAPAAPAASTGPTSGTVQTVEAGAMVTQLKGIVIPSLQVTVSPRDVAAEITAIHFSEGKRVKKGDLLAELLPDQYQNRLTTDKASVEAAVAQQKRAEAGEESAKVMALKADAALLAAQARLTRAKAFQERAAADFEQAKLQNASGTITALDYQKYKADDAGSRADFAAARADEDAAKQSVEAAKADKKTAAASKAAADAELAAAQARCAETDRLVRNCRVLAPIDGTVLTKSADKGALVSPMSFNVAAGICSIADLSKLEVEIDVPERQVMRIKAGQVCELRADADTNRAYRGVVDRVMPIADDTKNVVKVRIRAYLPKTEKPGAFLKPKLGVTATVKENMFALDPSKDYLWGDEEGPTGRKAEWAEGWAK